MLYKKDDILGFETDTVWGMGCFLMNEDGVNKIYEFKDRDRSKPLILMSSEFKNVLPYIKNIPSYADELIEKFFPGALTLIFEKTDLCPYYITSNQETVGVRIPNHKGFYDLIENFEGKVLATTSLNLSNNPPVESYEEAILQFGDKIKIVKPQYKSEVSKVASTVVLCTKDKPIILRQGAIHLD